MKIAIINGPNLNLLGKRETDIYGNKPFEIYFSELQHKYPHIHLHYFQSNVEGELINELQGIGFEYDGIIFNPGGYTHTSVSYTHLRAHETPEHLVCRLLLEKKK